MKIIKLRDIPNLDNRTIQKYFENGVVIPTETVYGLSAEIDNEAALKNMFKVKGRPTDNPLIVHISSLRNAFPLKITIFRMRNVI